MTDLRERVARAMFAELAKADRKGFGHFRPTLVANLADAAIAAMQGGGWRPIETAPEWRPISEAIEAAKADDGWIGPCLFGIQRSWGWETWVGQCDNGDIWLGRSGDGECWGTDMPTHFMPLPPAPSPAPQTGGGKVMAERIDPAVADAMGEVVASMMRRHTLDDYRAERSSPTAGALELNTGTYEGCLVEAEEMIRRLRSRGFDIVKLETPHA